MSATMEMAAPKIIIIAMAVKILGAAPGLRPSALMLAKPAEAIISDGPSMHIEKIRMIAISLFIFDSG